MPVAVVAQQAVPAAPNFTQLQASRLLIDLGPEINTPDGLGISADGSLLILSVPNFNNDHLLQRKLISQSAPPFMAQISADNKVTHWYDFTAADMHPDTGRIVPMDNAFGPDGNLYVADMQVLYSKAHKSRVLRINVQDGKATGVDVVAEGFIAANGLVWEGDTLYLTDSALMDSATQKKGAPFYSGVYALPLAQMQGGTPIRVKPYAPKQAEDPHLVKAFQSKHGVGSGTDGVAFDDKGRLFVTLVEEGAIYQLTLDSKHKATNTKLFARDPKMRSADGLVFDAKRQKFYVADPFGNAVHAIDTSGRVTTLQKNGDTTGANGELDEPVEIIVRGDQLLVVNMDIAWLTPGAVNTETDSENNMAVIDLPAVQDR